MISKAVACGIAAVIGGVLVSAVGAVASPHSNSVNACATKHGVLTLESHGKCPKGSKAIKLGQRGPAGPAGPSAAYSSELLTYGGGAQGVKLPYRVDTLIRHLVVPHGSYIVTADVQFAASQVTNDEIACDLEYVTSKGILQGREANESVLAQYPGYDDVTVHEPVALPKGADIEFFCDSVNNSTATRPQVADATLIAQAVGTLHAHGDVPKVL
jgi:hypothetical protein